MTCTPAPTCGPGSTRNHADAASDTRHAELRPKVRSAEGRSNHKGRPAELRPKVRSAEGRSNHKGRLAELRPEVRSAEGRSNNVKARFAAATLGVAALFVVALPVSRRASLASRLPARVEHDAASGRFVRRTFTDGGFTYQYQVFFPEDYDP